MRFTEISESTTSGSVSTVAMPMGEMKVRTKVDGLEPVSKVMSGKAKKKGPYANSISEGKKKVQEADLQEDDIIVVPGQGRLKKTGFVKHDPDRAEHEGETLKNSLHTIIRVASELDKQLSTKDNFPEWISEKVGTVKSMMVTVADYLASAKEMQHDPDAMDEGQQFPDNSKSLAKRSIGQAEKPNAPKTASGHPTVANRFDGKAVHTRVEPTITQTKVKRKDNDKPVPNFLKKEVDYTFKTKHVFRKPKNSR